MPGRKPRFIPRDDYPPHPALGLVRLFPWLIAALLIGRLATDSFYTVAPYEQAVVMRYGKLHATTAPGLHFKLPLADRVIKVSIEEHGLRMPFANTPETSPVVEAGRASEDETLMLTGDLNTASVEWTIQWKVADPEAFIRKFSADRGEVAAEDLLATVSRTVMNRLVGDYSFDEVIGAKRSDIAFAAQHDTQRILESYGAGLSVTALQMQRVVPPERVKPAFDKVNASIQEKQKLENEAESKRNQILPQARAAKDKLIREAEGFASRRKAEASGEIEALMLRFHAYQRAPEATRRRLYLETMHDVLKLIKNKTILDANLSRLLPVLDLNQPRPGADR